jgi:hypothetical protein
VDPTTVNNPYALAAVFVVLVYLAWNQRESKKPSKRAADTIEHETKPNSGSSMKDSLNRIEATLRGVVERVEDLESVVERRGTLEKREET